MKWVTRERPKIDRLACPWLIRRFIDAQAEIRYVPVAEVLAVAASQDAIPFDVPGVELSHSGPLCSFDAFLAKYHLEDDALARLAEIVRAADTDTLDRAAPAAGLLAVSLGLAANIRDDQDLLRAALPVYDALYTWCRSLTGEGHGWYPQALQREMELGKFTRARAAGGSAETSPWRADFPALDQRVNGLPLVYLDSAATTQRPAAVLATLQDFYRHDNANPGKTLHALARRAHERDEAARRTVGEFLHAQAPDEVVWVRGTTEGINLVASAWARPRLGAGDEILLTLAEHASNLLPWRLVAEQTGATIRYADVDDEGRVRLDDLERQLSARTRLVSFSHVSNVVGYVNPAAEICSRAHRAGACVLIDAAQSAPHVPLDVQALGCDFLVFSSHKMLGPMGAGVLWGRRERLDEMAPYQSGSNMAHEVDLTSQDFEHTARRFSAGTPNVSGAVGLSAAIDYLRRQDPGALERHEAQLTEYGLERLSHIKGLRLLGPRSADQRLPVFSFVIPGHTPGEILTRLDACGIAVRAGDLAALPLLKRLGVTEAVRASCYLYTETRELDRLAEALDFTHLRRGS